MKEMFESKIMIAFVVFILGITFASGMQEGTKKDSLTTNEYESNYSQK